MNIIYRKFSRKKSIKKITKEKNFFGRKKYWKHKLRLILRLNTMS